VLIYPRLISIYSRIAVVGKYGIRKYLFGQRPIRVFPTCSPT
jgi:hypothetical protein